MGLSFKISKKGKRYTPKGGLGVENETQTQNDNIPTAGDQQQQPPLVVGEVQEARVQGDQAVLRDTGAPISSFFAKSSSLLDSEDHEVSLSVNLFPNGFNVGLPNELIQDVPKDLLPYDSQAVSIFSDIEHERIPGNFFDDIPCKYVNGAIVCEVRDYRTSFKKGENPSSPKINKVVLKMGMEQVINDIASIADANWEYIDILKMEAQVLKALQPVLNLSPKPMLDGFQECHPTKKLNFGISQERKKRRLVGEFSQQQPLGSLAVDQRIGAEFVNGSTDSQRLPLPLPSTSGQEDVIEVDPRPNARVRAKAPLTQGQSKKSGQSRQKNKKENTTGGKEALATSQLAAGHNEDLAKDASIPTPTNGNGKNSVKSSSKNRVASVANTTSPEVGAEIVGSHANTSHESGAMIVASVLETSVPCSSVATDPVLGRLLTIKNVSERHGLYTRKHKDCWTNDKGRVYGPTSMIAFHLKKAEDERGSSHYAAGPSDSSCTVKVTTLTFVHVSWVFSQGNLSKRIQTTRKLILKERLDDRWTEAVIQHDLPGQRHFFRNSEYAKRFAVQFVLLMAREGYTLNDEKVEFEPLHFRRSTAIGRQQAFPNNGTPAAFERYPRPPTGTSSPWPSNLPRGHDNVESVLQHPRVSHFPATQLEQVSQQWQQQQQSINNARIRQQLAQRRMAMGGSGLPGSPVGPAPIRPARTAGIGSVGPVDGQGRRLMSGSMVQENGSILPMGQVAVSDMPGPGVVSHQNIGQPLQMGSDQQLGNAAVLRHASPQLDSRSPGSDNRSSPNPSARSVVE